MHSLFSPLQQARFYYQPKQPACLTPLNSCEPFIQEADATNLEEEIKKLFPFTYNQPLLSLQKGKQDTRHPPLKVGVVLSGGQAPGGHTVITALYDALHILAPGSQLFGLLGGISGLIHNKSQLLTQEIVDRYRHQGGFDMIGSGRTKLETTEQFQAAKKTSQALDLDGLVIIGGDDSNTNAAFLAEFFKSQGIKTSVVGVPKTIDGDLKNEWIETSFGFDTACKTYSEIIGNILIDSLSAKKYYFFIKLMGRSASHVTLECALQTHPNLTLISEEVAQKEWTLPQIVDQICSMICQRAKEGKNYGAILIPEGLIEFVSGFKELIRELNEGIAKHEEHLSALQEEDKVFWLGQQLTEGVKNLFFSLPHSIQMQLALDRDPHGNVQVSKIETERLLIELVSQELCQREKRGGYQGKFSPQPIFCGYEGRSGLPSNFDCQYCSVLGQVAALLICFRKTGYMSSVQGLAKEIEEWRPLAIPLVRMLHWEKRKGEMKAVIRKATVQLDGKLFKRFENERGKWLLHDDYRSPGPIQFFGPEVLTNSITFTLQG